MKKQFAIIWPSVHIKSLYYSDPCAIYFDNDGWWIYSDESKTRNLIGIESYSNTTSLNYDIALIRNRVNWWAPIWTRWIGSSEDYENLRSHSSYLIFNIMAGITKLKLDFAIYNTGIPHHYETSLFSIACELSNLKQIFLYAIFDGRLLPLIQFNDIKTRSILNFKINDFEYTSKLELLLKNKLLDLQPQGTRKLKLRNCIYFFAALDVARLLLLKNLAYFKYFLYNLKVKKSSWANPKDYGFIGHLNILNNQRKFLNYYTSNQLSISNTKEFIFKIKPHLLIAAHYQPEATSFPEGGDYFSHIDIVLFIRKLGYKDTILYKEHPASWLYTDNIVGPTRVGLWRSREYLEDLISLGCELIPANYPLSINMDNSKWYVPVTISGTIAIERSLAGLHTIVTGQPWFKGLPGTIHITELSSLAEIPKKWIEFDSNISNNAIKFLNSLLSKNTLINLPGIGSGIPLNDATSIEEFNVQYGYLLNKIRGTI